MPRYDSRSEVDIDERRSTYGGGRSRYEDRETDINFRSGSGALPRERERTSVIIKERDEVDRRGSTPAFLRDDYGQTDAGAMVLRARDREDVTYAPRRRRDPSPEKVEREEIIIRRDERSDPRPPAPRPARRREESREREEIIIRRDERSSSVPPAPAPRPRQRPREEEREREEIIIRRDERSDSRPEPPRSRRGREESYDQEEIIIRRDERSQSRGPRYRDRSASREREEIIIRRNEVDDYAPPRRSTTAPIRDEREREEIIIRRTEDDTRSRRSYQPPPPPPPEVNTDRQEIIIRRDNVESEGRARAPPRRRYEDDYALSRPVSHERSRARSYSDDEDEIIIRRDERQGRSGDRTRQEIIIRRSSTSRSPSPTASVSTRAPTMVAPPPPEPQVIYAPQIHQEVITHHRHVDHGYEIQLPPRREPVYSRPPSPPSPPPPPPPAPRERSEERIEIRRSETRNGERETEDIIISRNDRSVSRGPPPERRVERDDFEIDYRRQEDTYREPTIGARYGNRRDYKDGLWTEVTKDLVLKEAIQEMGYEYEETEEFYYIFKYMQYVSLTPPRSEVYADTLC